MIHKSCFVIQRFDGGVYDRRYRETFAPAIEAGGAKPMRADEVLGTVPIIEKIESGLKNATIAFCDASEDNANVFLELGYALAIGIPTVIVCDKGKRSRLPFDISHRTVIFYATDAQSDFEKVSTEITKNVNAAILEAEQKISRIEYAASNFSHDFPMQDIRRACLLELLDQDLRNCDGTTLWMIQRQVVGHGINERMIALAVSKLIADGYIEKTDSYDQDTREAYVAIKLTDHGRKEILRSYADLMRAEAQENSSRDNSGDELPF